MLKITASLADGTPVDLRDTLTGLDDSNIQLLITAIRHESSNCQYLWIKIFQYYSCTS